VQVQIAYAIGVADPVSVMVDTFGTGKVADDRLVALIRDQFGLKPREIIESLDLLRPVYLKTAAYGHFGRSGPGFTWEKTDRADSLRKAAGPS
jgi:S-adenosylmethionine synthetase